MLLVALTVLTSLGSLGHCCDHTCISHCFTSVCFVLAELLRRGGGGEVKSPATYLRTSHFEKFCETPE